MRPGSSPAPGFRSMAAWECSRVSGRAKKQQTEETKS
jgi:hypothetical protein